MTEMIRYKFEGMLEHEEGNEPGEYVQITVSWKLIVTILALL